MFNWLRARFKAPASADIISSMDPWVLACAVGAENGTIGVRIGFESWLALSKENWLPQAMSSADANERQILNALRDFVKENAAIDYATILRREETKRGKPPSVVIGPGETLVVPVDNAQAE